MFKLISLSSKKTADRTMVAVRTINGLDSVRPAGRNDMIGTDPFATDCNYIHKRC